MSGSTWTAEEYARIALALLYPGYLPSLLTVGYTTEILDLARRLYVAIQQLPEPSKIQALAYADQVKTLVDKYTGQGACAGQDNVIQVDKIKLDPKQGLDLLERRIDYLRSLLSALVGVQVCPSAGECAGSGISSAVCGLA